MEKFSSLKPSITVPNAQKEDDSFVNKYLDPEKTTNVVVENINVSVINESCVRDVE